MVTFPAYWATATFTDQMAQLGWTEGPQSRTWNPTSRFEQRREYKGPTETVREFGELLCGNNLFKPFQLAITPEGPNSIFSVTFYSDDYDGLYPRDPILTTWSLDSNRGNQSVLWSGKTVFAFRKTQALREIPRRIIAAQALYENMYGPMTANYWQSANLGSSLNLTQLMNGLFKDVVAAGIDQTTYATELWYAQQLFRLVLNGVTVSPIFQHVLRKTQIVFPKTQLGNSLIGSNFASVHERTGYCFTFAALRLHEPSIDSDTASLVKSDTMPTLWWMKQSPSAHQTSDHRWILTQEYVGFEAFEPYNIPWQTVPGETFTAQQFDPALWVDAPSGEQSSPGVYIETPDGSMPIGMKPVGAHQWPAAMQQAIFGGSQSSYVDLG